MKYEDHQPLKRIWDGEYVLEDDGFEIKAQEPKQPSDSEQGKKDRGGFDSSFHFCNLCFVLHVFCSHHST